MKYIRTKDGKVFAYKVKNETDLDDKFIFMNALIAKSKKESFEILKFADTIEELCDEFVCENHLAKGFRFKGAVSYFRILKMTSDIYGAIWTDKGLIYVAKMNEKGELELL